MATESLRYLSSGHCLTPQLMTVVIIWKVNWISSGAAYSGIHTCTVDPEPWSLQPQIHCHHDKHRNISIKLGQIPDVKPISLRWAPHIRSRREKVIELAFSLPRSFICCGWKGKPSSLFRNFPSSMTLRRVMLNDCAKWRKRNMRQNRKSIQLSFLPTSIKKYQKRADD